MALAQIYASVLILTITPLSLHKILFHFKALVWESIILLVPPPHMQSLL